MVRTRCRVLSLCPVLIAFFVLAASAQAATVSTAVGHQTRSTSDGPVPGWIAAEANALSGRTLTVACSQTTTDWAAALAAAGLPAAQSDEIYGFSFIQPGAMYLSPYVCQGLQLGLHPRTRAANVLQVGWSVDVLLHESTHLGRFTSDEAWAEACARAGLPGELHRLYGVAYHSAEMSALTLAATWFRRTQSASYQGGTCPVGTA